MKQIIKTKRIESSLENPKPCKKSQTINRVAQYAGLTLKQYFQKTYRNDDLNKIQAEQQSQSQLQYQNDQERTIKRKPYLKSLTRIKRYEDFSKSLSNKSQAVKKTKSKPKDSLPQYKTNDVFPLVLPLIENKSCCPTIKHMKVQTINNLRHHHRATTEEADVQLHQIANSKVIHHRLNHPIYLHVTRKKQSQKNRNLIISSTRAQASPQSKDKDGFLMTFNKNRERIVSNPNISAFSQSQRKI